MINFKNRVPAKPNRKKIIKEDGTSEFVTIEYADEPLTEGTHLDRVAFMGIQGFEDFSTEIDFDNMSISTTTGNGISNSTITFNPDGTIGIVSSFTDTDNDTVIKTITVDGTNITGVIS